MKKFVKSLILSLSMLATATLPVYANNLDVSDWSIKTMNEAERYDILSIEWYYDDFRSTVTEQRLDTILAGVQNKMDLLNLNIKSNLADTSTDIIIEDEHKFTRQGVIEAIYSTLNKYDGVSELSAVDYFIENALILGDGYTLNLEQPCNTEQAVVFATRFIEHVYDELEAGAKGFAWKVENKDNTIYLLGSIHLGSSDVYPLHYDIRDAYNSSSRLYVEANVFVESDEMQAFTELTSYSDGTTIEDHISPEVYAKLEYVVELLGIPIEHAKTFKPWSLANDLAAITTTENQTMEETLQSSLQGIDMYFLSRSIVDNKYIGELEGMLYQGYLLDNLSSEFQEMNLESVLDGILLSLSYDYQSSAPSNSELLNEWLGYFIDGDIEGMTESYAPYVGTDEMSVMLFGTRDIDMAEKIIQLLEKDGKNTYFVVVGAGHFIVENSVLYHLEQAGYTVEEFYN